MSDQTYTMIIERDPDSGWLVGDVVELPGCHTQGPTLDALESNMREAIEVYLETVQPSEPRSEFVGTWQVKIPA